MGDPVYLWIFNAAITPKRYTQPVFEDNTPPYMEYDESVEQLSVESFFKEAGAMGLSHFYFV